jgi:hypothetical protein
MITLSARPVEISVVVVVLIVLVIVIVVVVVPLAMEKGVVLNATPLLTSPLGRLILILTLALLSRSAS